LNRHCDQHDLVLEQLLASAAQDLLGRIAMQAENK
jgi:hypothetical protein